MMKRAITLALLLTLLLSLCACGFDQTSEPTPEPTPEAEATPEPEPTPEPTPSLPTPPDVDIKSWEFILANSYNALGVDYYPYSDNSYPNLAYLEGQEICTLVLEPAQQFLQAARNAGFTCYCSWAYRNTSFTDTWYRSAYWAAGEDPLKASTTAFAGGLSDHNTGLSIDFTDQAYLSGTYNLFEDEYMRDTELYSWLVEHCAEYGFILRYPEGKEDYYGLACSHPAHFRYVGTEAAQYIMENGLCLEEFLMLYEGNNVYLPEAGVGLRVNERG